MAELGLRYVRQDAGQERSRLELRWGERVLAVVDGDLALPLHDKRLVSFELFRFVDDYHLALRLWFYWVNLRFDEEELLAFVPADPEGKWRKEARRVGQALGGSALPWRRYQHYDEVPDVERFDLLIDPAKKAISYAGTDTHWQEFWSRVDSPTLRATIASFRELWSLYEQKKAVAEREEPVTNPVANGLCPIVNDGSSHPCHNRPAGHVVTAEDYIEGIAYAVCPGCATRFIGDPERAVGILGKHAPILEVATVLDNAVSNNVLRG
jgi:hypothetical protein